MNHSLIPLYAKYAEGNFCIFSFVFFLHESFPFFQESFPPYGEFPLYGEFLGEFPILPVLQ